VYRAKQGGGDIDPESYARLSATLATHEAEAAKLEQQLREFAGAKTDKPADEATPPGESPPASASPPPPTPEGAQSPDAPVI